MKRIGLDARFLLRPLRGMPLYVTRLCELLPALNRKYMFYFFINKGYCRNDKPENYESRIAEIKGNNPNVTFVNYDDDAEVMWEQIYLPRLIRKHKIDLLHMPGNRICFLPGVPTVVTVHDVIEFKRINSEYVRAVIAQESSLRMFLYIFRMSAYVWGSYKFGFRRAKKVITVSESSSSDIVNTLKISSSKVLAIHHGLDEDFISTGKVDVINSELGSRKFVLMLGGDSPHKNPEGAIAAWAKVSKTIRRKYPLRIIGYCGNDQSPLLKALRMHGLQAEVEVKGWVTQQELIEFLRSAALFVYLSRYEGFGFPPLHAMASGTPVVASNCTSIPEVLGNVGFKFDPDDHDAIARGIETVLSDCDLWQRQSIDGVARSRCFRWKDSAIQHLKLYESVLDEYC